MNVAANLLIVDDDLEIRELLAEVLQNYGFKVILAADGEEMLGHLSKHSKIDLVILDVMLPGQDGFSLCRNIRAKSEVPIIMLTASGDNTDKVVGLECGADDYVTKPFCTRELVARIRAILRRYAVTDHPHEEILQSEKQLIFSGWCLDTATHRLWSSDNIEISLSNGEYNLLLMFLTHPQRVLSRDQLLECTKNRSAGPFDRSIDIQVSRIRQKIEIDPKDPKIIITVRGGGYMLATKVQVKTQATEAV